MTVLIVCWRWVLDIWRFIILFCFYMFDVFYNQVLKMPHTHLPHTSSLTIISFMPSTSTTKLLTPKFQWLPMVFQQSKESTNSATMLDNQMLHFMSTLLQELNLKDLSCWVPSYIVPATYFGCLDITSFSLDVLVGPFPRVVVRIKWSNRYENETWKSTASEVKGPGTQSLFRPLLHIRVCTSRSYSCFELHTFFQSVAQTLILNASNTKVNMSSLNSQPRGEHRWVKGQL